jgi:hypothetical protein
MMLCFFVFLFKYLSAMAQHGAAVAGKEEQQAHQSSLGIDRRHQKINQAC